MKKLTFTFSLLLLFAAGAFCQATYYWVGGAGPVSYTATTSWNTQLDGGGASRAVANNADILIFDGTNIGGTVPTTGAVTATTSGLICAQMKFLNGSNVTFIRTTTGSTTLNINGDTGDDLVIDATSTLTTGGNGGGINWDVIIILNASATGMISGTLNLGPVSTTFHPRAYITASASNSLVFANGSSCYVSDSSATSPFQNSVASSILFKSGSSLYYYNGRSPIGNNSTTQFTNFETGANFYIRGSIAGYTSSSWVNQKILSNLFIQNNTSIIADGAIYKVDTLVIDAGSSFTTHTSGNTPILGNLTVNGTFTSPAGTNIVIMGGSTPQTISGSGTINLISFTVANYSDVTLNKSISVSTTCNIVGKLNFGASNQITGAANYTSRVKGSAAAVTGNTTAGSTQVTGVVGTLSGNAGLAVTGTGLDANTNVAAFFNSNAIFCLSKPALATTTGTTFTFSSDSATLVTSNPNGMDTLTGSVVVTGTKSFQSGTNYIINAATPTPFGISSGSPNSMTAGNITLNAAAATNYNMRMTGTLTLNSGKFTIRPTDTVRIMSGNSVAGAPFSNTKYIVSSLSGANAGVLRIDNFTGSRSFPIGTATNYLPATLTPLTASDFAVSGFEGVTEDGTPTGTAFTPAKKAGIVDAIWTINRVNGTGDCVVQVNWPTTLEGSVFTTYSNPEIGIGRHNGTSWDIVTGTGDNTANTATSTFSSFSPFAVGQTGFILPIKFNSIAAKLKSFGTEISWNVLSEDAGTAYTVERSSNGTGFTTVGTASGSNRAVYNLIDPTAVAGKTYYRVKATAAAGRIVYSSIVFVQPNNGTAISIYPNPVVSTISVSGLKVNSQLRIINANGQAVLQQKTDANTISIDLSAFKAGTYTIEIVLDGKRVDSKSFVKE